MVLLFLTTLSVARADDAVAAATCALPPEARVAAVDQARSAETERERLRALLAARTVLMDLHRAGARDVASCTAYLSAVLSEDPTRLAQALAAARAGGALDPQGQPVLPPPSSEEGEALAPAIDPQSAQGQALLQYRDLVAGIGACSLGTGDFDTAVAVMSDGPTLTTASWALSLGPDRLLYPRRFARWSARVREAGALPQEQGPRRASVALASYHWDATDLEQAQAGVHEWNAWLQAQLGLSEPEVAELEMEVAAHHAPVVHSAGTVTINGKSARITHLPTCP